MPEKKSLHKPTKKKALVRATRRQTNPEKKKWNNMEGGGPGRPKGSTLDKKWKLTPNQMALAESVLTATNKDGFFPDSIVALARRVKTDPQYLRNLLRRDEFQKYLSHLLVSDGIMLEMSFWRGMQLGLQVGDPKVLQLYANMTGKIRKNEAPQVKVLLVGPDGEQFALPMYAESEITDAEVVEENFDDD